MHRTARAPRISPARSPFVSRRAALAGLLLAPVAGLALTACSSDTADDADADGGAASDGGTSGGTTDADAADGAGITITDPWAKAAESGMTAAFGTLTNTTSSDVTLVSVTSDVSDMVQLHETSADGSGGMSMQEKEGGFAIPAGGTLVLEPGGNHIMLMDLAEPLLAGDVLELTLVFADGAEVPMSATIKDFTGADENYGDDMDHGDMDDMDHEDAEDDGDAGHGDHAASDGGEA
ncbi:copper chaperone PCu(A)C [Brachybacterium sp. DNPG3]